jgi:hypothetical protein
MLATVRWLCRLLHMMVFDEEKAHLLGSEA